VLCVTVSRRLVAPPVCGTLDPVLCLVGCVVSLGFLVMVCSLCCKILTSIPYVSTRALVPCVCSHRSTRQGLGGWQVLSPWQHTADVSTASLHAGTLPEEHRHHQQHVHYHNAFLKHACHHHSLGAFLAARQCWRPSATLQHSTGRGLASKTCSLTCRLVGWAQLS